MFHIINQSYMIEINSKFTVYLLVKENHVFKSMQNIKL